MIQPQVVKETVAFSDMVEKRRKRRVQEETESGFESVPVASSADSGSLRREQLLGEMDRQCSSLNRKRTKLLRRGDFRQDGGVDLRESANSVTCGHELQQ